MVYANRSRRQTVGCKMEMEKIETVIIGGGLSGLYAAYLLSRKQRPFVVLEARRRLGGRILSTKHQGFFSDLGPSWYWPDINPRILRLIQTLGLTGYRQYEEGLGRFEYPNGRVQTVRGYATQPASWRLAGGMQVLIEKLAEKMSGAAVKLDSPVCEIEKSTSGAIVSVGELEKAPQARFCADRVILAIPPTSRQEAGSAAYPLTVWTLPSGYSKRPSPSSNCR